MQRATGRHVAGTQAEDRRLIALVEARPLLYARSSLPVASYYSHSRRLWHEVARAMGWSVPEVRRKWSHIRNSYSRHLRNETHGARTGRGRMVSRWHLADDLEFLRHHMATDTRPVSGAGPPSPGPGPAAPAALLPVHAVKAVLPDAGPVAPEPAPVATPAWYSAPDDSWGSTGYDADDDDYFHFFRGLHADYRQLAPRDQRQFRRQCLSFLHELVDGAAEAGGRAGVLVFGGEAAGQYRPPDEDSDDERKYTPELRIHEHDADYERGEYAEPPAEPHPSPRSDPHLAPRADDDLDDNTRHSGAG